MIGNISIASGNAILSEDLYCFKRKIYVSIIPSLWKIIRNYG